MPLALIYARSLNHCIGANGEIPWRLPNDFKHFKQTTMGSAVIMGRKTYEDHCSAFPGRLNIVVSRQDNYQAVDGVHAVNTLQDAVALAKQNDKAIFIIGGSQFFENSFVEATDVYETVVDATVEGDTYIPAFDFSSWKTHVLQQQQPDEKHAYGFTVYHHQRNQ